MIEHTSKPRCVVLADVDPHVELEPLLGELGHTLVRVDSENALLGRAEDRCAGLVVLEIDFVEPLGGLRIAEDLLARFGLRVVFLSSRADSKVVSRAKLTHPYGYLLKPLRTFDLRSCLELALQRATDLPTRIHRPLSSASIASLSARERDVLRLIAKGHTSKDIASALAIAKATVDTYRGRLSEKLGARSRADLVRIAQGAGLLD